VTQYDISLAKPVSEDEINKHDIFLHVEKVNEHSFIVECELDAEKISAYIINQQWGLTRFTPHETSLEQIFIDLTHKDVATQGATK
jgi:hypothetical protein